MFVRFVVGSDGQHNKELTGILTEARLLRDRGALAADENLRLGELYEWFNEHVPVPPFSPERFPRDAVAWFRNDAREPVTMMWGVVALLREHGVEVRLLRSANPGRVVYEDCVQVVVEEWNRLSDHTPGLPLGARRSASANRLALGSRTGQSALATVNETVWVFHGDRAQHAAGVFRAEADGTRWIESRRERRAGIRGGVDALTPW